MLKETEEIKKDGRKEIKKGRRGKNPENLRKPIENLFDKNQL